MGSIEVHCRMDRSFCEEKVIDPGVLIVWGEEEGEVPAIGVKGAPGVVK